MKPALASRLRGISIGAVLLLLGLLAYVALRTGPLASVPVRVITVENSAIHPALFGIGTVEAQFTHRIGPVVAGRVKSVLVQPGDTVKAGQLLGDMDPVDMDERIGALSASRKRAEANLLPMLAGVPNAEARKRAVELLTALDVQHRAKAMPSQLSGGEQQRVSIARGLINRPPVILADEPTAPLDSERALAVIRILNQLARQYDTAIIVVTHGEKIIPTFKRAYHIRDGVTHDGVGQGRGIDRDRKPVQQTGALHDIHYTTTWPVGLGQLGNRGRVRAADPQGRRLGAVRRR